MDDLLFLAHRIPFPPNKGDKIRSYHLLRHLAQKYRVHLACHVDDPNDMAYCPLVEKVAGGECLFLPLDRRAALMRAGIALLSGRSLTEGYFHDRRMKAWIGGLARRYPIRRAVVFGSAMAPYVLETPELIPSRSVLDMVDVDSDKWRQYAGRRAFPAGLFYGLESRRLARLEMRAAQAFGHTVLVSPHEVRTFASLAPHLAAKLHSIGNGVDLAYFDPGQPHESPFPAGETAIVMTGLMDYWPNIQGAEWFARKILPEINRQARFYVVGANPPANFLRDLDRVTVTGGVKDVRPYLAHAALVVAPLQIARGVQNKVLEAMAMARPVVATTAATRALAAVPGRHLLVEDEACRFAAAVNEALRNPVQVLGREGRRFVEQHHRWDDLMAAFSQLLDSQPLSTEGTEPMQSKESCLAVV